MSSEFSINPSRPSGYSIYKRIGNLLLVVLAAFICVNVWLYSSGESQQWYDNQASQLGRSLTAYAAKNIVADMRADDQERIATQLALIAEDPHVISASVFTHRGQIVQSTSTDTSVLASFLLDDNAPLVFVEEIKQDEQILGYLRILVDEDRIMQYHDDYQFSMYEQTLVLMLLAGLAGILIARAFYKIRYRHLRANS